MKRSLAIIPIIVLVCLIALLSYGLTRDPSVLPSSLIGNEAPELDLPRLEDKHDKLSLEDAKGQVVLVNIWASWCYACRSEVPLLEQVAQRTGVPIIGLAYKDQREAADKWLKHFGNPFADVVLDDDGNSSIDWGISGVPETFVIDAEGKVRHKVTGPVDEDIMEQDLLPLINKLQARS